MNPEQSDFYQLRKLLGLKRHEQPPPGYFDKMQARISASVRTKEEASFWSWFCQAFELKPVVATAFALAVFCSLGFGLVHAITKVPAAPMADAFSPAQNFAAPAAAMETAEAVLYEPESSITNVAAWGTKNSFFPKPAGFTPVRYTPETP